jgi:feruloyl-CoA synthase
MMGDAMVLRTTRPNSDYSSTAVSRKISRDIGHMGQCRHLRIAGITALVPIAQDIVVTGHDKDEVRFLVFPNIPPAGRWRSCPMPTSPMFCASAVRDAVAQGLPA